MGFDFGWVYIEFGVDSNFDGVWILIFYYAFLFFGFVFGWLDFLLWIFVFWTLDSNEV